MSQTAGNQKLIPAVLDSSLHSNKSVHLPQKQVLQKMEDKQKAVPKEAELMPLGDCFWPS
ncbi:MAG: hypothetical protein E7435_06525 [Ruminococcaceae bacterium]|nr:hypothetical protein [Oscillospiraceae bacterium]